MVNPVTVTPPKADGIAKNEMSRFSAQIQPLFAQLKDAAGKPRVVAVQRGTPANQNALNTPSFAERRQAFIAWRLFYG